MSKVLRNYFKAHKFTARKFQIKSKMSVFTQHLNPITGENEWNLQREDYDYKQEIARSSYADMLHDKERNEMYYEGIKRCVGILRRQNKQVHVLDIGTGTGLLSMMAISCGVDSVTACETFTPMAECAKKIFKLNGFEGKVNLIGKRSTELECGEGKEMPRRANLLVTEVFDTELIGEGALQTFAHAKKHLLTTDALIVPSEGTLYAQVVQSPLVKRWNRISPIPLSADQKFNKYLLRIPESTEVCSGAAGVHDLQLSEIPQNSFTALSKPIPVFEFNWSDCSDLVVMNTVKNFHCLASGTCDAVFMWWSLKMDPLGDVILSCAPVWDHPKTRGEARADSSNIPWRDHWMQAVYYFPKSLEVSKSDEVCLIPSHDEYSLWFSVSKESSTTPLKRPVCECGLHATTSRTRLGQLSDPRRVDLYTRLLKKHITPDSVCLFVGDCCLMAIVAAKLGARHVYIHETNSFSTKNISKFILKNGVDSETTVLSSPLSEVALEDLVGRVSLVFCEPYFNTCMLPWDGLLFLYRLRSAKHLLEENALILPNQVTIRCLPVHFRDLWKIRAPLHTCCGFKMEPFDQMIQEAIDEVDMNVEPHPLWEYPCTSLGSPTTLLTLPLSPGEFPDAQDLHTSVPVEYEGTINGLAIWTEWQFEENEVLTTGPVTDVILGEKVTWDMYSRQGVHLFKTPQTSSKKNSTIMTTTTFDPLSGVVKYAFQGIAES